jgi:phage anti-repressor protein
MPADYLSLLPSLPVSAIDTPIIAAFDPFTPELQMLQRQDQDLHAIFQFLKNKEWPASLSKQTIRNLQSLAPKVFFDKNKLAWIRLEDHKYPGTALWLPERYRKEALCETQDSIFAGHNAALKSYVKLTTSYFWPTVYSHVLKHTQTCLRCQQRKMVKKKNQPLAPLLIPDTPNLCIHADLFGPMVDASRKSAYILCITDAFTKYAVVTSIPTKTRKLWEKQFLNSGSVNLEYQPRFTQMVERSLSTNYSLSCANYSMSNTQRQLLTTHSATHRWKCSTKWLKKYFVCG